MNKEHIGFSSNRRIAIAAIGVLLLMASCTAPSEPEATPSEPVFVPTTTPPNPVDQGIFADVGSQNAIVIQWEPDTTFTTSGYLVYRAVDDSTVGTNGILSQGTQIADLESTNPLLNPPPTSFDDTTGIVPGATYFYQLQAFHRASNNNLSYSQPTRPGLVTSFKYAARVSLLAPNGTDTLHGLPLQLFWEDPNDGGSYQIIVQRQDNQEYVWSGLFYDFANPATTTYPTTAPPLQANVPYQWRVKWIEPYGGSSSPWTAFTVEP